MSEINELLAREQELKDEIEFLALKTEVLGDGVTLITYGADEVYPLRAELFNIQSKLQVVTQSNLPKEPAMSKRLEQLRAEEDSLYLELNSQCLFIRLVDKDGIVYLVEDEAKTSIIKDKINQVKREIFEIDALAIIEQREKERLANYKGFKVTKLKPLTRLSMGAKLIRPPNSLFSKVAKIFKGLKHRYQQYNRRKRAEKAWMRTGDLDISDPR